MFNAIYHLEPFNL